MGCLTHNNENPSPLSSLPTPPSLQRDGEQMGVTFQGQPSQQVSMDSGRRGHLPLCKHTGDKCVLTTHLAELLERLC